MRRLPGSTFVAVTALLLATACGNQSSGSAASAAARPTGAPGLSVNMTDANQFVPATLTVPRGATVTWVNTGQAQHTVTDDPSKAPSPSDAGLPGGAKAWDSGIVGGGESFSHTFDTPGQYTYFCIPHAYLGMVARITVSG